MSDVTPVDTPTPQKTLKTSPMTNFNYEGSYEVGMSCYFWIIRLVNSQLALHSHVRCYPHNTPWYLSDEVTNIRCEMMYPDQLSDKSPPPYLVKWSDDYKMWDEATHISYQIYPNGIVRWNDQYIMWDGVPR